MERQGRAKMAKLEPRWPKRAPRWSQDGQLGAKMEPILAKLEPRWPKRVPRWSQDGQVGVNMEPTWLQDGKDVSTWADIVPILKKLCFPLVFVDFTNPKESLRLPKREPRSGQDDQVGAKMAPRWPKRPPRWPSWSQEGGNMAPR